MLTIAFPAAAFGTNCYVLAAGEGEECLVVDPGIGVEETLREVLTQHRLRPAAVLLTHGTDDPARRFTPGAKFVLQVPTSSKWHGKTLELLEQGDLPGLQALRGQA